MKGRQQNRPAYGILVILVILISVAFFLLAQTWPSISDTIGYVHAGRQLANGSGLTFTDENNQAAGPYFSLYAFQIRRSDDPRMFLGFPPGFPILLAGAIALTGQPQVVHYVVPLLAIIGLIATFHLGTLLGKSEWVGLGAALLLVSAPAFWEFGTASWSEVPSLTLTTAGVCFYLLSREAKRPKRHAVLFSLLGGILISFSFFIRYANVTIILALALYELASGNIIRIIAERQRWPFWGLLALGVAAIPLFNQLYYGGALLTSYSPAHGWYPWPAFSFSYALGPSPVNGYSLVEAWKTGWHNFPGLLLAMPIGWLLLPRRSSLLLAGATLSTLVLYSVYAFAPAGVNSRFLLPIFPFACVAISHSLASIGTRFLDKKWRSVVGITIAAALCVPIPAHINQLRSRNLGDAGMVAHVHDMVAWTPSNAVFLSYAYNDQIIFYGDRSVLNYRRIPPPDPEAGRYRMETLEPCLVQTIDRLLEKGTPVYYIEDRSPPFWKSLAILQQHYAVELVQQEPNMYQVDSSIHPESRESLGTCRQ